VDVNVDVDADVDVDVDDDGLGIGRLGGLGERKSIFCPGDSFGGGDKTRQARPDLTPPKRAKGGQRRPKGCLDEYHHRPPSFDRRPPTRAIYHPPSSSSALDLYSYSYSYSCCSSSSSIYECPIPGAYRA
jgi:hypothetical protein